MEVHERTHMWRWTSKDAFVDFVARNKGSSIQAYTRDWLPGQKLEVATTIRELLDQDFPDKDTFSVPMIANIVVGRKK